MARPMDLEKMSYAELKELRDRVDEAMIDAKTFEKRSLREKMEALAAESGFTVAELIGGAKRGPKKGSGGEVKFRNPKDPSQTWSGRGRKPGWLVDAEKKGAKVENFAV